MLGAVTWDRQKCSLLMTTCYTKTLVTAGLRQIIKKTNLGESFSEVLCFEKVTETDMD